MISVVQAQAFKTDSIRKVLGIPAMPKEEDAPPLKLVNPFRSVMKVFAKVSTLRCDFNSCCCQLHSFMLVYVIPHVNFDFISACDLATEIKAHFC